MSFKNLTRCLRNQSSILLCLLAAVFAPSSLAGTVVSVSTPLGEFSIELYDEQTPGTVSNFLNYVNSGRYNGTLIHRSEPDFVIQGGWLSFDEAANSLIPLQTDGTISNEPGISNTRGTVAMAKVDGDPNSATSQWFVNLVDNTFLDSSNGGFTVFGRVIGDGMTVVDAINDLTVYNVAGLTTFPLINYTEGGLTNDHTVNLLMSVVEEPVNSLNNGTGQLDLKVDAGSAGLLSLSFSIVSTEPQAVIKALADSVVTLTETVVGIATFDSVSGELVVPELAVNGAVAYHNLVFMLSDADQLLFTLQSFEQ